MRFRPCIDIHNGTVKQIVGGSLEDGGDLAKENFASEYNADFYAEMYRKDGLRGGHIILLNPITSPYYAATESQALSALRTYPEGMQIGGGITAENALYYIESGASHVIVTSYVFRDGAILWDNLEKLEQAVGRERIVIDVSCRRKDSRYDIVTNRWQTFADIELNRELLEQLSTYCSEFLVHGVDVEGKAAGAEKELIQTLTEYSGIPITYAGGIGSMEDLEEFRRLSKGKLDFTIGSALDLFGGSIPYEQVKRFK